MFVMKLLPLMMAIVLAVTSTAVTAFQPGPAGIGPPRGGGGGTPGGGGGTPGGGGGESQPWKFSHPEDGMQCYSEVDFVGVGPQNSVGGLALYSYDNQTPNGVYASELTLQIAVLVDTDPGIDWVGPSWALEGSYYATIMPALSSLNMALLSLTNQGAVSGDVYTLVQVNSGQGVQFSVVNP